MKLKIFKVALHRTDGGDVDFTVIAKDDLAARKKALSLDKAAWKEGAGEGGQIEYCEITVAGEVDG
jgi:hypothetical protein